MPKRISKTHRSFLRGVSTGLSLAGMSLLMSLLRDQKGVTQEEAAQGAGVNLKVIQCIETADIVGYLRVDLGDLTKIAIYYDVALDVRFRSLLRSLKLAVNEAVPFEKEASDG